MQLNKDNNLSHTVKKSYVWLDDVSVLRNLPWIFASSPRSSPMPVQKNKFAFFDFFTNAFGIAALRT